MTRQRGHWPSFVHEVVGGVWALVKWLLANVAVLVVIVAAMGVLAVASGVVDGFNRWVTGHRIAPAVLVAVKALLTWFVKQGWDELKAEKASMKPRDPDPPDPVGFA